MTNVSLSNFSDLPRLWLMFHICKAMSKVSVKIGEIRESGSETSFLILVYNTNVSKVHIGNKEIVPGSFLTIFEFKLVWGYVYYISM